MYTEVLDGDPAPSTEGGTVAPGHFLAYCGQTVDRFRLSATAELLFLDSDSSRPIRHVLFELRFGEQH